MSHEYVGAIVIVLISLAKIVGIEIGTEEVTGLVTGVVAIWIAIRRYSQRDISVLGVKK